MNTAISRKQNTVIVIEGPDCTGKTTLAKHISEVYDVPMFHLGLPPVGQRHWDIVRDSLLNNPANAVYDRMCIGSFVFGLIKPDEHNRDSVNSYELLRWERLMKELNVLVIRAHAPRQVVLSRFDARGDAYVDRDTLDASYTLYNEVWSDWADHSIEAPFITYNTQLWRTPEAFVAEARRHIHLALGPSCGIDARPAIMRAMS